MFLLVDYGKVLCSTADELQQTSNAFSQQEYNSWNSDCFVVD